MPFTFPALKGNQFGKEVFTVQMSFADSVTTTFADPEVQRDIIEEQVQSISEFVLEAMENKRAVLSAFNAITTSLREDILEYLNSILTLSTRTKLHIADGQHRRAGIERAMETVEQYIHQAREDDDEETLVYWKGIRKLFDEYTLSIVVFTGLNKDDEAQLFYYLNHLAKQVTGTESLSFDRADKYNLIAKALEHEIPKLRQYGIEKKAKTLTSTSRNPAVATLATWNNCVRIYINGPSNAAMKRKWNSEKWDFEGTKAKVKSYWTALFDVLPEDFNDRRKYLCSMSVSLQGVAAWLHETAVNHPKDWKKRIDAIKNFDWSYDNSTYQYVGGGSVIYNASEQREKFQFIGTRAAINAIPKVLNAYIDGVDLKVEYEKKKAETEAAGQTA